MGTAAKIAEDIRGICADLAVEDLDGGIGQFAANARESQVGKVLDDLPNSRHGWGLVG